MFQCFETPDMGPGIFTFFCFSLFRNVSKQLKVWTLKFSAFIIFMFQCFETNLKHLVIYFIYRLVATILLYNLYVSMFQCFTETKCMPWDFCGGFVKALLSLRVLKVKAIFLTSAQGGVHIKI